VPRLTLELAVPSRAPLGDTVEISIRVRNTGKRPAALELSGRPVAFDVVIRGPDGSEVWRRLRRGAVAAALVVLRLEPGEAHDFSLQWAEVDDEGSQVRPGRYTVRGMVPIDGQKRVTAERELLIER
jgi:hypothetical protein